ncbi:response regulator [Alteromonas sp. 5E99-2]|uniref:response regulator n=1 Tax=Alteromonas sp. 5E99-2 TaxID=2817683 RepID=UPI001A99F2D0|nr:response regulator [Alteromonas sp. 5E99-2]MBO1256116.1 response regulator [Alteromonas sp. 5E99-2]
MANIKFIIYCKDTEAESLLIETLTGVYKNIVIVSSPSDIAMHLKEGFAKIVLVSSENFKHSLAIYYHALSLISDDDLPEHAFVPLVSRRDEKLAWDAFKAGFADDYIVSRPLYETHRPIMICDHLLKEMGMTRKTAKPEMIQDQIDDMPEKIKDIVQKGIVRKENLKSEFKQTIKTVSQALDNAAEKIQANQDVKLDMEQLKSTLAAIRSDEIRPILLQLQDKAISLLEHIVSDISSTNATEALPVSEKENAEPKFNNLHNAPIPSPSETKTPQIPKILVVDDDAISLSVSVKTLQMFLAKVDTTSSGRRALASLNAEEYDLVLIDIHLNDCNGLFVIDQIRNSENKNTNTPKVVLTSNRDKQSIKTASEMGASEYLIKPLTRDTIIKLYKKYDISLLKKK